VPVALDHAPSLAASGRRRPPQTATQKNSRRGFFGDPSGRNLARRHAPHRTAPGYRACGYKTASGRPKWLNRDPIGLLGGINLYSYVGNNPINGIDPLGLLTVITTVSGNRIVVGNSEAFVNAVENLGPNQIASINFAGHANSSVQGIDDSNAPNGEQLQIDSNGNVIITGPSLLGFSVPLGPELAGKLAPGAKVNLSGCHAGDASKTPDNPTGTNIAQATSVALPGAQVSGSSFYTFGPEISTGNFQIPGTVNTYVNGVKQ